jgi:hypothetical protein
MRYYPASACARSFQISTCRWIIPNAVMLFLLFLFLLNVSSSATQENEFWKTKDYRHWTEKECETMLVDSPWAKNLLYNSNGYVVQLFSGLPIRQALVRQKQIAENYDKLSQEKRQEFDKGVEEYLSAQFPKTIVVHVISGYRLGRNRYGKPDSFPCPYWQNQTTETLNNIVSLIPSKGDRIPLGRFVVPQPNVCEFQFIFPRQQEGHSVPGENDRFLRLVFTGPPAWSVGSNRLNPDPERMLFEFKLSDMRFKGDIVY